MFQRSTTPFLLLSSLIPLPGALAWDPLGHQTVGFLAHKYFSAQANQTFGSLLGLSPSSPSHGQEEQDIGDAAAWADTVRTPEGGLPWSKNWHFINPVGDDPQNGVCTLVWPSDCPGGDQCIVSAIMNQTSILLSPPGTYREDYARNATKFLLHFFGDMHQPLHATGFKYGGNGVRPVCFGEQPPCLPDKAKGEKELSLHHVWDSAIPRKLRGLPVEARRDVMDPRADKEAAKKWADDIFRGQQQMAVEGKKVGEVCAELKGPECILKYAAESNQIVCKRVLSRGEAWVKGTDLSREYFEENKMLVQEQIGKAGLRLAAWMNAVASAMAGVESQGQNDQQVLGDL